MEVSGSKPGRVIPKTFKMVGAISLLDSQHFKRSRARTIPISLGPMGRRKFLLKKCLTKCGEKGGPIVVTLLVPRVLGK